jgi:hypothetical protein
MNRRHRLSIVIGLCGLSVSLTVASAWAEDSPFVSRWHWNREQSKLPVGERAPADMMIDIARADSTHVKWSAIITNAQGRPMIESFDTPANGEFYPVSGGTMAAFRLSGPVLDATFKGPAGESDALSCTLSQDQRKMTCTGAISTQDGKTETYTDVYDRN